MSDDLGDVDKIFVFEVRGELEVVRAAEGAVSGGEVLHRPPVPTPVDMPAGVYGGAQPV